MNTAVAARRNLRTLRTGTRTPSRIVRERFERINLLGHTHAAELCADSRAHSDSKGRWKHPRKTWPLNRLSLPNHPFVCWRAPLLPRAPPPCHPLSPRDANGWLCPILRNRAGRNQLLKLLQQSSGQRYHQGAQEISWSSPARPICSFREQRIPPSVGQMLRHDL